MGSNIRLALLIVAFVGAAETNRTTYYDVAGRSAHDLRESLDKSRPLGPDGERHDAVTTWYVQWQYHDEESQLGCRAVAVNVSVEISTTIPRWTDEADASPSLLKKWRSYYDALLVHEDGHRAIAVDASGAIRDALSKLPTQADCAALKKETNRVAQALLDEYRSKQRQYDLETDHGRTQGARFP